MVTNLILLSELFDETLSGPYPAISDYRMKYVIGIQLSNQTAQALYEHYICIYGVPTKIVSDQGTHFINELMNAPTHLLDWHHIKTAPYHPQTNGIIERFNATFERIRHDEIQL